MTGGGKPKTIKTNPVYEHTLALIKPTLNPLINEHDSGAAYHVSEDIIYIPNETHDDENFPPDLPSEIQVIEPVTSPSGFRSRSPLRRDNQVLINDPTPKSSGRPLYLKSLYNNMESLTASKVEKKHKDGVFSDKMFELKFKEHEIELKILDQRLQTEKLKNDLTKLEIRKTEMEIILLSKYSDDEDEEK